MSSAALPDSASALSAQPARLGGAGSPAELGRIPGLTRALLRAWRGGDLAVRREAIGGAQRVSLSCPLTHRGCRVGAAAELRLSCMVCA